jgi:hypothetical protein
MQVFRPSQTTHQMFFIPRYGIETAIVEITNELRGVKDMITINGEMINGIFSGFFNYAFKEGATYEIEAFDGDTRLLFRGKAFATDETDLQNYKLIR